MTWEAGREGPVSLVLQQSTRGTPGCRGQIGRQAPTPPSMAACDSSGLIFPSEMKSESGFLLNLFYSGLQFFFIHYSFLYLYAGICLDLPNTQRIFTLEGCANGWVRGKSRVQHWQGLVSVCPPKAPLLPTALPWGAASHHLTPTSNLCERRIGDASGKPQIPSL